MKGTSKKITFPRPSELEVDKYLSHWQELENYNQQEKSLEKLLKLLPHNTEIEDVLLKASTINAFYSTNIFAIYPVPKLILNIKDIDERLKFGDVSVVNEMEKLKIQDKERSIYSFATKYCSFHNPQAFPIYDRYVDKLLCLLNKEYKFSSFTKKDLKDYAKFKSVLLDFQTYFVLQKFDLKEIDRYLWLQGKNLFQIRKDEVNKG